jgi:hypothetical protein
MRLWVCLVLLLSGCAKLPAVVPARNPEERTRIAQACMRAFPKVPWSAAHSIDASMPLGKKAVFIGATRMDATTTRSMLMSPEGIVLFDVSVTGNELTVHRALPPLDREAFAEGLLADVRQALAAPAPSPYEVGFGQSGEAMCRFQTGDDRTTDVRLDGGEPVSIRGFRGTSLAREVTLVGSATDGWFPGLVLRAPGMAGYALRMRLIDHDTPDTARAKRP